MDPEHTEELISQGKPRDLALGLEHSHPFRYRFSFLDEYMSFFPSYNVQDCADEYFLSSFNCVTDMYPTKSGVPLRMILLML